MDQSQPSQDADKTDARKFQRIVFTMALLLFVVATRLAFLDKTIAVVSTVYSSAALCLLFSFMSQFKNFSGLGIKAELKEVKEIQNTQAEDIDLIQLVSFAGIVSKHEIKHLYGLAAKEGGYEVRYSQDLRNELKRLDDFGFIFPNKGMGLNSIDEKYGADINKFEARDKTPFSLKDYLHITEYGEKYIELARKIGLPERP